MTCSMASAEKGTWAAWSSFGLHFPEVNRRSLQRDLKAIVDIRLLVSEGSTSKLVYRMKGKGRACDKLTTRLVTSALGRAIGISSSTCLIR